MLKETHTEIEKYDWIDALRGYAILMVMMAHSAHPFWGDTPHVGITYSGNYGVTLFFIASSFTLFNSYSNRLGRDGKNSNRFFFIRRLFRIAPMYWIACGFYIVVGSMYQSIWLSPEPIDVVKVLANVTFINGLYLPAINYIPPGGWSVGDEMLFYLTIPALFLIIKSLKSALVVLVIAIVCSILAQIVLYYVVINYTSYDWYTLRDWSLYFWFPNQFPVFCLGILLFFFIGNNDVRYKEWMLVATVGIYLLLGFVTFDLNFPNNLIQPEYIYGVVLTAFAFFMSKTKLKFIIKPINKLGKVSFSAYLIHFLVIEVGLWLLTFSPTDINEELRFALLFTFTVTATYFISKITFALIEKQGIAIGERIIQRIPRKPYVPDI
ncbi:MAG: acyltransferase [Chryseolinea sp.]